MRNVPELRFDGYDGEWEEKKLSKIAKFSKGKGYSKTDLKNSGNPIYLYGEMYTNYKSQINDVETFTDKIKANSVLSKGNEVLIPSSGETAIDLARASHMNIPKVLLGGDLNIIEPINGFDPHFLALELSNGTIKQSLAKKAQGKSVVHLYNTDIKNQKVNYPIIDEQEKIGSLFRKIDALIEIQEGKVSKMEDFKKSMLQKMFPKKDELVPEFRFDGFDGEWEEKIVGDLLDYEQPTKYIVSSEEYYETGIPVLTANKSFILGYTDEKNIYNKGEVVLFDDFTQDMKYVNFPFMVKSSALKIVTEKNSNLFFMFNLLSNINLINEGHKRHYISVVQNTNVVIPSLEEQEKIGKFFKNLDTQIENEEKLLDSYKMMKKSLLQKMFV